MRAFGLASLTVVTGFALTQACGGDDSGVTTDQDAGGSTSSTSSTSSGGSTTSSTSGGTSSSGGTDGGADGGADGGGKSKMTFFVSSIGSGALGGALKGTSADGLAGGDALCKGLATKAGGADHTWAAYLSTTSVKASSRIGAGPWTNHAGTVVASDLTALHSTGIKAADIMDEAGKAVPQNESMILTGSNQAGEGIVGATCQDWTSNNKGDKGEVGSAKTGGASWNTGAQLKCDQTDLSNNNSAGRIYCFAKD